MRMKQVGSKIEGVIRGGVTSLVIAGAFGAFAHAGQRSVLSLDGVWDIAEGSMNSIPERFDRRVPVPGLVDMALPAFADVGRLSEQRQAFWYRRQFRVKGPLPDVAILKVHKAKYGMQVWLNGHKIGEHLPCFTPALLDVREALKGQGQDNKLVTRLGANRESLAETLPRGWDFEKYLYIPGIYDAVELILADAPYIKNVQAVPDIATGEVRIVVRTVGAQPFQAVTLGHTVREWRTQEMVAQGKAAQAESDFFGDTAFDFQVTIPDCRLWSPEDPFLYTLELTTAGDSYKTRFGMRSFAFDKASGRAVLNGKPYYMRGTNVCVLRFFEDEQRQDRPWRRQWVRKLHQRFQGMHWNAIRYCIGFPPEFWYDIADEEGFLIQDEFPIWYLSEFPQALKSEVIAAQYKDWMQERWNHPCVVIWDAQNESVTEETGKALAAVRDLDLSGRPWDNGWAAPQSEGDCIESHPYFWIRNWMGREPFQLSDLANTSPTPRVRDVQQEIKLPLINNEYAWLWLNRDGTPTCLTRAVYDDLIGPTASIPKHRYTYARTLAALTEFWRCHRQCAAVMHFCGLAYSRPGGWDRPEAGATSDHFVDLESLNLEPFFVQYVRDAFAPVGLMIDLWQRDWPPGQPATVPVKVINDLYKSWEGEVVMRLAQNGKTFQEQSQPCAVAPLGQENPSFELTMPEQAGEYLLTAELVGKDNAPVRSLRDIRVVTSTE